MKTKCRIVILSLLADLDVLCYTNENSEHMAYLTNFSRYLVANYPNTNVEIDVEKEREKFFKLNPHLSF